MLMAAVCIWPGGMCPAEASPQVIEATGVYIYNIEQMGAGQQKRLSISRKPDVPDGADYRT